jgi:hypothetical protein
MAGAARLNSQPVRGYSTLAGGVTQVEFLTKLLAQPANWAVVGTQIQRIGDAIHGSDRFDRVP